MREIQTRRLLLRPFRKSDYDDLFEFLSQFEDDEFEGYPGITYENGREHLKYRLGSEEFYAIVNDWMDYYNNDRYQWDLEKLSPREYYRYRQTGVYPLKPGVSKNPASRGSAPVPEV